MHTFNKVIQPFVVSALLAVAGCAAPYQSTVQFDPMTGETVTRIDYLRLDPVQGQTSFGRQFVTGSAEGINMSDVVVSDTQATFRVAFVSTYGTGLVGGGQASSCVDDSLRMNIDGELFELMPVGQVRQSGYVTERTWGQVSGGTQAVSQGFVLEGERFTALMNAQSVFLEYCDIVGGINETSLAQIQQGVAAAALPYDFSAQTLASDCDGGDGDACYLLGRAFMAGSGGLRQDPQIACQAYAAACAAGSAPGCAAIETNCSQAL